MMHGPINIRKKRQHLVFIARFFQLVSKSIYLSMSQTFFPAKYQRHLIKGILNKTVIFNDKLTKNVTII